MDARIAGIVASWQNVDLSVQEHISKNFDDTGEILSKQANIISELSRVL